MKSKPFQPCRADIRSALARAIRALRRRVPISQEGLALASGLDRSYMGEIERGLRSPTIETIFRLIAPLGVTLSEFAAELEKNLNKRRRPKGDAS